MTLADVLDRLGPSMPGVESAPGADGSRTWTVAGVAVAILDPGGSSASFRLDPVLAAAARRTPDVAAGPQGAAWVTFRPAALDGHAVDRAEAWFAAAVRRAHPGPG